MPSADARCLHARTRPSDDDDLEICLACGRIVRALTREGELEIERLLARFGVEETHARDGSFDYTIRREVGRPRLRIVHAPPPEPPAERQPASRARTVRLA